MGLNFMVASADERHHEDFFGCDFDPLYLLTPLIKLDP